MILFCFLWIFCFGHEIVLLHSFDEKQIAQNPQNYLWSEKLDGVRAYWDGKALYTRNGNKLNPPAFFLRDFPPFALDGELWSKRGEFEKIASIIQTQKDLSKWQELKFYIFEVPHQKGGLLQRLEFLKAYLQNHNATHIAIIPQNPVKNLQDLYHHLQNIIDRGGEGLVIREKNLAYYTGRKKAAMKLKPYQDSECKITQYFKGKGKFEGMVGSFLCQDQNQRIRIGSGMDENFRKNPPPLGTIITYKFFGRTQKGKPRFPTFLRIRKDYNLAL